MILWSNCKNTICHNLALSFNLNQLFYVSQGFPGFYRGFFSTVLREVPFSFLQFPMWEFFKVCRITAWSEVVCVFIKYRLVIIKRVPNVFVREKSCDCIVLSSCWVCCKFNRMDGLWCRYVCGSLWNCFDYIVHVRTGDIYLQMIITYSLSPTGEVGPTHWSKTRKCLAIGSCRRIGRWFITGMIQSGDFLAWNLCVLGLSLKAQSSH